MTLTWYVIVAMDTSFAPNDIAKQSANYSLIDLQAMRPVNVHEVIIDSDQTIKLLLDPGADLIPLGRYHLDIAKLTFPGIKEEDVSALEKRVTFPGYKKGALGQAIPTPRTGKSWKSGDAEDREGSNIYASVSVTKSRTKAAVTSVDLLIDTPVVLNTKPIHRDLCGKWDRWACDAWLLVGFSGDTCDQDCGSHARSRCCLACSSRDIAGDGDDCR